MNKPQRLAPLVGLSLCATLAAQEPPEPLTTVQGHSFYSWQQYTSSPLVRQLGLRCGTPPLVDGSGSALSPPSDCAYYSTSPQPQYEPTFLYRIPIVFHVIERTNGVGHVPMSLIESQIDVLNQDFQALPGSNGAAGNDGMIQFYLATVDPNGQPTTGVTYSTNNDWYNDTGGYWNSLAWDTNRYLNLYTNNAGGDFGYVPDIPQLGGLVGAPRDRVVCLWSTIGQGSPVGPPYDQGRTATHEIGHYLGLWHTFDGACAPAANCYSNGDRICDTNPEANPQWNCPGGGASSCGSSDPIHNYMDYSVDLCMWEFTPEQVNRMRCTLEFYRPDLFGPLTNAVGGSYCSSFPNSSGAAATIHAEGQASVTANDLRLHAASLPAGQSAIFYYGPGQVSLPFGNGLRCVGGALVRLPVQNSGAQGSLERALDLATAPGIAAGSTTYFQSWFRDPQGFPTSFDLSDGLFVDFLP